MAITIRQVAELAQVSTATVSYVLNGTGVVTEATKQRVLAAIADLGYQPHHAARSMRGRSQTLGLILPGWEDRLADPATAELLAGIVGSAAEYGYHILLATAESAVDEPQLCVSLIQTGRVDGVILLDLLVDDPRAKALRDAKAPHICAGPAADGSPTAVLNSQKGAMLATEYLVGLGHRRIGLIMLPSDLAESEPRYQGYAEALEEAGIEIDPELIVEAGRREDAGYQALNALLELPEPPTAVLACSDDLAFGALHALHDAEVSVGARVSLVGFDDLPQAAHSQPPLTTLRQPRRAQGRLLAELLTAAITGREPPHPIDLVPRLVVRRSSGPPMLAEVA